MLLEQIDRETAPGLMLHLIVDNYATHKHAHVKAWLKKHPRFHIHFTPNSSSWLNLIERWFAELSHNRLKREVFNSVKQLVSAIEEYVEYHNQNPKGYQWNKSAEQILEKVKRVKSALDKCLSE